MKLENILRNTEKIMSENEKEKFDLIQENEEL